MSVCADGDSVDEEREVVHGAPQQWQGDVKVTPSAALMVITHHYVSLLLGSEFLLLARVYVCVRMCVIIAVAVRSSADSAVAGLSYRLALQLCGCENED